MDFIGVCVIFIFTQFPPDVYLGGGWKRSNPSKEIAEKEFFKKKWYPKLSLLGFILVALGFLLQIIPTIYNL
jgi:hypothetical protein